MSLLHHAAGPDLRLQLTALADGRFGLWRWPEATQHAHADDAAGLLALGGAAEPIEVAIPSRNGSVRRRRVEATKLEVAQVVDALAALPFDANLSPSVGAVRVILRLCLGALAQGRALPVVGGPPSRRGRHGRSGPATRWRVASWTPAEGRQLDLLVRDVPPELCCEVANAKPLAVRTPAEVVESIAHSVTTAIVATAASWSAAETVDRQRVAEIETEVVRLGPVLVMIVEVVESTGEAIVHLEVRNRTDHTSRIPVAELWRNSGGLRSSANLGIAEPDRWLIERLRGLAELWGPAWRLLDQKVPDRLNLDQAELASLILDDLPRLTADEVEVHLPRDLVKSIEVVATVSRASNDSGESSGAFSLEAICSIDVAAVIDGSPLSAAEVARIVDSQRDVVWLRNSFVKVDQRLADRLRRRLTLGEAMGMVLGGTVDVAGVPTAVVADDTLAAVIASLRQSRGPRRIESAPGLEADLRPYQRLGLGWLASTAAGLGGGILADDMGLGKTVQVIALHQLTHANADATGRPTLVVGPASLIINWEREVARFAPGTPVRRYHGAARTLESLAANEIVVTTYGTLRADVETLAEHCWGIVVADEAQHVKNPQSLAAEALRRLRAECRLAVTGTPVENRLTDLWALMDWVLPGLLGTFTAFKRGFSTPIERNGDQEVAARLARVVAPFVLRRTKADPAVVPDLPPRLEIDHGVAMTAEQLGLYRSYTDEIFSMVRAADGIQRRGLVLKLLSGLKQICDHPALFLQQSSPLAHRSGKLDALDDVLGEITDAGDAALIFTQYVNMGELLVDHLGVRGIPSLFLHGQTTVKRRQEMVDAFQNRDGPPVFVISIKAGGTGLNLTRANHVIHYDRWWNPAVENQASDRAWRIGQDRTVLVHRLNSVGTLEERIAAELERKRALADSVIGEGEAWLSDLRDEELLALIELGAD